MSTPRQEKQPALLQEAQTLNNVPWCEEYEKMISGLLYDSAAPKLVQGRLRARKVMSRYNNSQVSEEMTAQDLVTRQDNTLRELFGKVGANPTFEAPVNVDYGCNITVGDNCYANFNTTILDSSLVTIGHRLIFGPNVSILGATHETGVQSRRDGIEFAREVVIGDDVWVGGGVIILGGVTIGDGCTIGAGSVVTKSIPPYSIALGSPARVIRQVEPPAAG